MLNFFSSFLLLFFSFHACYANLKFVFDTNKKDESPFQSSGEFPRRFRSVPTDKKRIFYLSGSAQFTEKQLKTLFSYINTNYKIKRKNIHIIDLRQENHLFIEGYPISLYSKNFSYNWGVEREKILQREESLKNFLKLQHQVILHHYLETGDKKKFKAKPHIINQEKELVRKEGGNYYRLSVTDHCHPSDEEVEIFLKIIRSIPPSSWIHIHCRGGRGRTSTFIYLIQMLHNKGLISIKNLHNHFPTEKNLYLIGHQEDAYRKEKALKRREFLENFLLFVQSGEESWKKWNKFYNVSSLKKITLN